MKTLLKGHISESTAYIIADYPYGFRLRCQKRVWIETTKSGSRIVEQTSNPKVSGLVWNKPKKSTYSDIIVMFIDDETEHISFSSLSYSYDDLPRMESFLNEYESILPPEKLKSLKFYIAAKQKKEELSNGVNIYDMTVEQRTNVLKESFKHALQTTKDL